jgi:DNA-binding LacI/PurR family transcriptional regulator
MEKKPTTKDIARKAEVLPVVVPMALNKRPRLGKGTRAKILRIAKELNYQPSYVDRKSFVKRRNIRVRLS